MESHRVERDVARTALIAVCVRVDGEHAMSYRNGTAECDCGWTGAGWTVAYAEHLYAAVVDALVVARQDVPCETCGGQGTFTDPRSGQRNAPCPDCTNGSVPGPLLIDVMMGEPTVVWSESSPGVGMMEYRGRTVIVMEQDVYRRTPRDNNE